MACSVDVEQILCSLANHVIAFLLPPAVPFPRNFIQSIRVIHTRLFRIFAIIYTNHFSKLEEIGAASHLNTSFKHFMLFAWEFDLVPSNEVDALKDIIEQLKKKL